MALHAHEILATAAVKGNSATIHAFPVDELSTMFFAKVRTDAYIFDQAISAEHVFFAIRVFDVHCSCTVLYTAEVWLFTLEAHVENYFCLHEHH